MSSGERPIGAAKGKQSDTEALCQPPPPRAYTYAVAWVAPHAPPQQATAPGGMLVHLIARAGDSPSSWGHPLPLQVQSFMETIDTRDQPPTYFKTNSFTKIHQSIVDSYGIARCAEVQWPGWRGGTWGPGAECSFSAGRRVPWFMPCGGVHSLILLLLLCY